MRRRRSAVLASSSDAPIRLIEIEDHHEGTALPSDPPDIVRLPPPPDFRSGFEFALVEAGDFEDAIGHETDARPTPIGRHIEDDDPGRGSLSGARQSEFQPEIDNRISAAADVDHPEQKIRGMRQG